MTVELMMLAYSVALLFVLVLIQATSGVLAQGLMPMANSRDDLKAPSIFQARTKRLSPSSSILATFPSASR